MTDPKPAAKQRELTVLVREIKPAEIQRRLGIAYDLALAKLSKEMRAEATAYQKELRSAGTDLERVAQLVDQQPSYIEIEFEMGPKLKASTQEEVDRVLGKLSALNKQRDKLGPYEYIRKINTIVTEAKEEGVLIALNPKIEVSVSRQASQALRKQKEAFVEHAGIIITGGLGGKVAEEPFMLTFDSPLLAARFGIALQEQIGIAQPEGISPKEEWIDLPEKDKLTFDEAQIPRGKYPLVIEKQEDGGIIEVRWPNWIQIGKGKEEMGMIPKRTGKTLA